MEKKSKIKYEEVGEWAEKICNEFEKIQSENKEIVTFHERPSVSYKEIGYWAKKACGDLEQILDRNTNLLNRVNELTKAMENFKDIVHIDENNEDKILTISKSEWSNFLIALQTY